MGSGGTSGLVTVDSETFRLDKLDSDLAGGTPASTPFCTRVLSRQ